MREAQRIFITGTDTGVGKSWVSSALVRGLRTRGETVAAYKPVASGALWQDGRWCNDDTEALFAANAATQTREAITPFLFSEAIAPHIAAAHAGTRVSVADVQARAPATGDWLIVEGAGGWRVPLNERELFSDLARALCDGVVLVVALRLGCINHALLSCEAIRADGLSLLGWVANRPQPEVMGAEAENLATLQALLPAPCLGVLEHGHLPDGRRLAGELMAAVAAQKVS